MTFDLQHDPQVLARYLIITSASGYLSADFPFEFNFHQLRCRQVKYFDVLIEFNLKVN